MSSNSPSINIDMDAVRGYMRSASGIPEQPLSEIRAFLRSLDQRAQVYDDHMARLQSQISLLRTHREAVDKKRRSLRAALAPIQFLPNSLLTRIFRFVTDDTSYTHGSSPRPRLSPVPFRLASVCSRWQSLCLSCADLWTELVINLTRGPRILPVLDWYLERSQKRPLTLHIVYDAMPIGSVLVDHTVIEKLASFTSRWQHVTFTGPALPFLVPRLQGLDFPIVESLKFNVGFWADLGPFVRAPNLLKIMTQNQNIRPNQAVLRQITNLTYPTSSQGGNLHDILALCSNLDSLKIMDYDKESAVSPHSTRSSILPTLTSLWVHSENYSFALLRSLSTPALTSLRLQHGQFIPQVNVNTISYIPDCLDRSGCSLTKLTITLAWTDNQVIALLQRLPKLEELVIQEIYDQTPGQPSPLTDKLMNSLHGLSPLPIIPCLRALGLMVYNRDKFNTKSFADMVVSRWHPGKLEEAGTADDPITIKPTYVACIRLVQLGLLGQSSIKDEEHLPLIHLRKMGLHFNVFNMTSSEPVYYSLPAWKDLVQ
ncbi:hypothetical protein D9757_006688 [Collybiopsis confluens]|uniref:F-box domain-containing protein n=1 Tax=Collybiopsis confluens TaxID=2823264 RepID=A0A8H5HN56_9AGAR|nr:hypothetical protein D9757_006688 [Collybiopsis confluens]